jgi:hypothetical protein
MLSTCLTSGHVVLLRHYQCHPHPPTTPWAPQRASATTIRILLAGNVDIQQARFPHACLIIFIWLKLACNKIRALLLALAAVVPVNLIGQHAYYCGNKLTCDVTPYTAAMLSLECGTTNNISTSMYFCLSAHTHFHVTLRSTRHSAFSKTCSSSAAAACTATAAGGCIVLWLRAGPLACLPRSLLPICLQPPGALAPASAL